MPKLQRWLVVSKMVEVIDGGTKGELLNEGVHMGGGFNEVHQHILVNAHNKERVEDLLAKRGYTVQPSCRKEFFHPEIKREEAMREAEA